MATSAASPPLDRSLTDALAVAGPPLLFALRLWASVCFALFIAFRLQLDNPYWAGTSAAIVCQPDVFMLAVFGASEICIGIACAGIVLGICEAPSQHASHFEGGAPA